MVRDLREIAQKHQLFVLENGKVVRTTNPLDWIEWMRSKPRAAVKTALPRGRELYTSFMGFCGEHRESQPLTFATALKPEPLMPEFAVVLEWYVTWDDAQAGHKRYANQFSHPYEPTKPRYSSPRAVLSNRVKPAEEPAFREDEMKPLLTPDQMKEYRAWPHAKQLHIAHILTNGHSFVDAKRLASDFLDIHRQRT